jgi:hypothetical protein
MAITSPRLVASGFYRNHLYVTLGLTTLAALVGASFSAAVAWLAGAAAVLSYAGSVCWLYESKRLGQTMVSLVAWLSLLAAWVGVVGQRLTILREAPPETFIQTGELVNLLLLLSTVTSGLVLGVTTAAMLLGHWYLNAPGMELAPLRRLLVVATIAVCLQMLVSGAGLAATLGSEAPASVSWWMFVALRWSFGLIGVLALLGMAWQTLKIPNTQSATGILYVAVIGVFVGELAAALLSAESTFPL